MRVPSNRGSDKTAYLAQEVTRMMALSPHIPCIKVLNFVFIIEKPAANASVFDSRNRI